MKKLFLFCVLCFALILTGCGIPLAPEAYVPEGSDIDVLRRGFVSIGRIKCAVM